LVIIPLTVKRGSANSYISLLKPFALYPEMKIFLSIFFLIGIGFMLIEISLLQKLTLYIGQPVMALTVLLFSLLLGAGMGSFCSALVKKNLQYIIAGASILVCTLAVIYSFYLPNMFDVGMDSKIIAGLYLIPLGFLLGFPFPLTIRLMKISNREKYVAWMWGVNGIASIVGSILAVIIGILIGFSSALYIGVILYVAIAVIIFSPMLTKDNLC
jgi:hypothetical protein